MYAKVIVLTVLATLLVVAALFTLAFVVMPQFAAPWQAYGMRRAVQRYGPDYGPGMMGGGMMRGGMMGGMMNGGMMNGGMMGGRGPMMGGPMTPALACGASVGGPGYWNTPVAPNNPSDSPTAPTTPAIPPSSSDEAPTRTPVPSNPPTTNRGRGGMMGGQTPGGLIAVSPDGRALPIDSTNKLPANTAAQKVGNLNVTLALAPYPPSGFSKSDFDVTLTDDKGLAVADAKVSLNLTMPAMWMPTNTPTAQHVGNGRYHATGMFTMRGLWRMEVIVERGGARQSAFFDVWL